MEQNAGQTKNIDKAGCTSQGNIPMAGDNCAMTAVEVVRELVGVWSRAVSRCSCGPDECRCQGVDVGMKSKSGSLKKDAVSGGGSARVGVALFSTGPFSGGRRGRGNRSCAGGLGYPSCGGGGGGVGARPVVSREYRCRVCRVATMMKRRSDEQRKVVS